MADPRLRPTEKWFYRRGLPFFVEDYRSSTDVWTRASPALAVIFIILMLVAATTFNDLRGAITGLLLALVVGVSYALWNVRRGQSWRALPERVTWPVLVAFVILPALVAFAAIGTLTAAGQALVIGLLILGLVWVVTRYALLPLVGWAVRYTFRGLGDLYRLTTRALPLMLLFVVFLFLTTELWQVTGALVPAHLWTVIGLFIVLGIVFMVGRTPEEVRRIEAATNRDAVVAACAGTPLADVVEGLDTLDVPVPLSRRQQANIGLVMVVAQFVQVALFAVVMFVFLVAFGSLTVPLNLQEIWMAGFAPVDPIWTWGDGYGVTHQMLRISLFLAAFSGFYVTIYTAIDATYREQFYDRIRVNLERSLSVRRAYVALRRRG